MKADDEKDRFGNKLRDLEKGREDKFFAQRDRELVERMKTAATGKQEEIVRELARGRCPKCVVPLATKTYLDVTFEECPSCQGMWVDKGELDTLARRNKDGWLARYFGLGR